LVLEKVAGLEVKGDAWFDSQLTLENWGDPRSIIHGHALFSNQGNIECVSELIVMKNIEFEDEITFKDGTGLFIGRNALFKKQATFNNKSTKAFINGHARFKEQTTLSNGVNLTIRESTEFRKSGDFQNQGVLCVGTNVIPNTISVAST